MLEIAIFILIFGVFVLVLYQIIPMILERLENWQKKKAVTTSKVLDNIFVTMHYKRLLHFQILCPVIFGALGFFMLKQNIVGIIVGVALGLIFPQLAVRIYDSRRRQKFNSQLVDGLMILSGSLKAGLSLLQTFEVLVEEMPQPISQEFNLLLRENRMGVPLEECLAHLKKRMRSEDLDLVVTAMLIGRETGGELPGIFNQLVFTIRERDKLLGKVKALTVQGRLQGIIMSLLPVAFVAFAYKTNPHFFDIMLKEKVGQFLMLYAFCSYIIGVVLIKIFSKVEV